MHRSRRATHPSHDGPVVRDSGRWGFSVMEWKDQVMGSKSEVSPPRSAVREFFSSLAGMITIGLAAGLVLCSPFFIYWQRSSPETRAVSPGATRPSRGLLQRRCPSRPRASNKPLQSISSSQLPNSRPRLTILSPQTTLHSPRISRRENRSTWPSSFACWGVRRSKRKCSGIHGPPRQRLCEPS